QRPPPHDAAGGARRPAGAVPGADAAQCGDGRDGVVDDPHHPVLPAGATVGHRGRRRFGGEGMSGAQPGTEELGSEEGRDPQDIDVAIILASQHEGGAYPAGASFSQYDQCWLRDGSFIAYAMDVAGQHDSASRFHRWVARAVMAHEAVVHDLVARRERDEGIGEFDFLPARFTPKGEWLQDGWPNFQLD